MGFTQCEEIARDGIEQHCNDSDMTPLPHLVRKFCFGSEAVNKERYSPDCPAHKCDADGVEG